MSKKTKIVLIILVVIGIMFPFVKNICFVSIGKDNYSAENLIQDAIKVQYRRVNKKELDKIFTSDYIEHINNSSSFYKKQIFYTIDEDFMDSFTEVNDNEFKVSVSIEDRSGSYIEVMTLKKDSDGKYLIDNIEIDI